MTVSNGAAHSDKSTQIYFAALQFPSALQIILTSFSKFGFIACNISVLDHSQGSHHRHFQERNLLHATCSAPQSRHTKVRKTREKVWECSSWKRRMNIGFNLADVDANECQCCFVSPGCVNMQQFANMFVIICRCSVYSLFSSLQVAKKINYCCFKQIYTANLHRCCTRAFYIPYYQAVLTSL